MKFNIAFFGPEPVFHVRRDFLLAMKYGLEELGHDVILSGTQMDTGRFNLVVGGYFLAAPYLKQLEKAGFDYAHVNTEIIANDMLNFNPQKTDFLGAYLPSMRAGRFVWDVVLDNLAEHRRYGNNARFLRWGWLAQLEDIAHRTEKDWDFYFFGVISQRRKDILEGLQKRGFSGFADHSCPYFVRNDRIARARVCLNLIQDEKYSHVGCTRICYLANNRVAILSEAETDPADYLSVAKVVQRKEELGDALAELVADDRWKAFGDEGYDKFRRIPMRECLGELLEASFGPQAEARAGGAR